MRWFVCYVDRVIRRQVIIRQTTLSSAGQQRQCSSGFISYTSHHYRTSLTHYLLTYQLTVMHG